MAELTYAEISKLLKYEPETGKLFWLPRTAEMFAGSTFYGGAEAKAKTWNNRYAGKEAFTSCHLNGYRQGGILGKGYLAHRVIWLFEKGSWPIDQLDHINGDRTDNRMENLREVSNAENAKNMTLSKRNKSGVCGVFWLSHIHKWWASIRVDGANKNLGYFDDFHDACEARKQAERDHGFHPNHGKIA
jgi:hypothetical protein